MVVENTRDLAAYEKTGKYEGVYHVLHGAISPLLGIGPAFLPIVPMVAVGNMVLVVILHLLASRDKIAIRSYLAVAVGAVTKFLALWLLIVKLVLPTLGLAEKQVAAISASFSWPQLVTAAIGGVLAVTIAPLIRKALRSK